MTRTLLFAAFLLVAATQAAAAGQTNQLPQSTTRLVPFSGVITDVAGVGLRGTQALTFSVFDIAEGGTLLWSEMQMVTADDRGRYAVYLGAILPLPLDIFRTEQARWLEVTIDGRNLPRTMLVAVPYALRAMDAETLGGHAASDYLLAPAPGTGGSGVSAGSQVSSATAQGVALGTPNYLAKYVGSVDLGNSAVYEAGGAVGIGTTTPFDFLHVRYTNTSGNAVGLAVQNLGNTATSYSGMLFYDQNGAVGQFQGFNNVTHEYRINNIARNGSSQFNGSINFMIGSASRLFVSSNGKVGIGTTTPTAQLDVATSGSEAVRGTTFLEFADAVAGYSRTGQTGHGVSGYATGVNGVGVFGDSDIWIGVRGEGTEFTRGVGVFGLGGHYGVQGFGSEGVRGEGNGTTSTGVVGIGGQYGVKGSSDGVAGVYGSGFGAGVYGSGDRYGVIGIMNDLPLAGGGAGVYGRVLNQGGSNYAGLFEGNVNVTGTLTKGGGSFKIDHPLDPTNRSLQHSFVESPDMMNVYNGNATLDGDGTAWVTLPEWFEALNRDFRYQLTAIGAPGPNLYIASEVSANRFKIAGGASGGRISWQVTGIRQDAWANAHRIPVEQDKPANERGHYLHPDAFGQTTSIMLPVVTSPNRVEVKPNDSPADRARKKR
jgi:hypothetical protein